MFNEIIITNDLIKKAEIYQQFRNNIKLILNHYGRYFDKFTCTNRDAFDGYLAEKCVKEFLDNNNIENTSWDSLYRPSPFLVNKVLSLNLESINLFSKDEIANLETYFYDKWDLDIKNIGKTDIKCASTSKTPLNSWSYGIPVIQVNKPGKEAVLLAYLIYDKDPKYDNSAIPQKCVIIGYRSIEDIKYFKRTSINSTANFSYHIENYELKITDFYSII